MKKYFSLLAILLFSSSFVFSQGPYLSLEGGAAFPLGNFSAEEGSGVGYAKTGFNGAASLGYKFSDRFAAGVKAVFSQNNPDANPVFTEISPWNSTSLLGAIKTSQALSETLYFEGEVNGGLMFLTFPAATLNIGGLTVNREAKTGNGLAYGAAAGLKMYLADDFALRFGLNYLGSKPSYSENSFEFEQKIDLLLLNWGIVFEL